MPTLRAIPATIRRRFGTAVQRRLGIDPRGLAALRVAVGTLVVVDLLLRARDLVAFYTDSGVFPRSALGSTYPQVADLSLHALSGTAAFQAMLFLLTALAAMAMLVGYRTRLATLVTLVLVLSLHGRNPLVLNAGDTLLRRLLFWGLFLPLGARWSVDALRRESDGQESEGRVASIATAALLVQVVIVYWVNAAVKLRGDRWVEGEAIRYVLDSAMFTRSTADLLVGAPTLLHAMDWLWLAAVVCSPLLLVLTGWRRAAYVAVLAGMHLGMFLTMRIGLFPLISVAALLPFLPPVVWDRSQRLGPRLATRLTGRVPARVPTLAARTPSLAIGPSASLRWLDGQLPRIPRLHAPPRVSTWLGRLSRTTVAVCLVAVLLWNAVGLGLVEAPVKADDGLESRVTDARWTMFAPDPGTTDGWFVVRGERASGTVVDPLSRQEVRLDRPPDPRSRYPNGRWRKFLVRLHWGGQDDLRPHLASYLCTRSGGEGRLAELTLYFVRQPIRFDGQAPTEPVDLGTYACPG